MPAGQPLVSVVAATHNRAARLRELLEGLRAQELLPDQFEVVIVDDGSTDETGAVLSAEAERRVLDLRFTSRAASMGPAVARQEGWLMAKAPLVVFTDDDCVPSPGWLVAVLRSAAANPGAIVQGRTEPMPWERDLLGPFSRTIHVPEGNASFQTCNVLYPRSLLERVGGFDTEAFAGAPPGAEDADLAWRAMKSGAKAVFEPEALVYHAVNVLGVRGKLRVAARWTPTMLAYVRHPEMRHAHFHMGVFWKGSHYLLVRAAIALVLPKRLAWLRPWCTGPLLWSLVIRARDEGGGPLLFPFFVIHDLIEIVAVARAALRYRHPMI